MYETMRERGYQDFPGQVHNDFHGLVVFSVFVLLVILGMYVVYRMFMSSRLARSAEDPLEVAKLRFAKGEITKTELADIRKELK